MSNFISSDSTDIHFRVKKVKNKKWKEYVTQFGYENLAQFLRAMVERGIEATLKDKEDKGK